MNKPELETCLQELDTVMSRGSEKHAVQALRISTALRQLLQSGGPAVPPLPSGSKQ